MKTYSKFISLIGIVIGIVIIMIPLILSYHSQHMIDFYTQQTLINYANQKESIISSEFDHMLEKAQTLAISFAALSGNTALNSKISDSLLSSPFFNSDTLLSTWIVWDKRFQQSPHPSSFPIQSWYQTPEMIQPLEVTGDAKWLPINAYQQVKQNKQPKLLKLYNKNIGDQAHLVVTVLAPIMKKQQFLGVVGLDYSLAQLHKNTFSNQESKTEYFVLVVNKNKYLFYTNNEQKEKQYSVRYLSSNTFNSNLDPFQHIQEYYSKFLNKNMYMLQVPITPKKYTLDDTWQLIMLSPVDETLVPSTLFLYDLDLVFLAAIFVMSLLVILLLVIHYILQPLSKITATLHALDKQDMLAKKAMNTLPVPTHDALNELTLSVNALIKKFHEISLALCQYKESTERYFEQPLIGMVCADIDKNILAANQKALDIWGYTEEEMKALTWDKITHPEDLHNNLDLFYQLLRGECNSYSLEKRYIRKDKTIIYAIISVHCARDEQGKIKQINAFIQDISQRKYVEQALHVNEERFNLAMKGSNDGLWDYDVLKNTLYYSPRWKSMLGYDEHEISSALTEWSDRLHPDDFETAQAKVANFLNQERPNDKDQADPNFSLSFRMKHKQGHYVWILSRGFGIWDEQGNPIRVVGIHTDMTLHKKTEEALRQAKEAAESANQAKSIFLANMSHELRTPLNAILGYAQVLSRDNNTSFHHRDKAQIIQRSGEYLLTLINDILDLSKIEANHIELYPSNFRLKPFLDSIVELFSIRAEQKGIYFTYEQLSHLPDGIHADEKRLRQIIINLLANAVKFTEQGGVTFKVGYHQHKIRFQIEDTGLGIAKQELQNIFKPFQQSGSDIYKAEGTGLGLAITERIVNMMEGEIHVTSALGHGSCFWIILALPESTEPLSPEVEPPPTVLGFEGRKRNLLVVDNKWENRSVVTNLLVPLGFTVFEAENGQEGLDYLHNSDVYIDLVLTDLIMPVMDGFEFCRCIRQHTHTEHIPVIALSASVFDHQQQQSYAAGCNAFIPKPLHADILLEKLENLLDITWIYNTIPDKKIPQIIDNKESDTSTQWALSAHDAEVLYNFALCGDTMGIITYVEALAKEDSSLQGFAAKISMLAYDFNDECICELVAPYREDTA